MSEAALIAELREEIAYLRTLLGEQEVAGRFHALRERFHLGPLPVRILCRLYDAEGRVVSYAALHDLFDDPEGAQLGNSLHMAVSQLRGVLKRCSDQEVTVENVKGEGYRLSVLGMARVRNALAIAPRPGLKPYKTRWPRPGRGLTDDQVRAVRTFPASQRRTAEHFGISQGLVHLIRARKQYADVPDIAPEAAPERQAA